MKTKEEKFNDFAKYISTEENIKKLKESGLMGPSFDEKVQLTYYDKWNLFTRMNLAIADNPIDYFETQISKATNSRILHEKLEIAKFRNYLKQTNVLETVLKFKLVGEQVNEGNSTNINQDDYITDIMNVLTEWQKDKPNEKRIDPLDYLKRKVDEKIADQDERHTFDTSIFTQQNTYAGLRASGLLKDILGNNFKDVEVVNALDPAYKKQITDSTFKLAKEHMRTQKSKNPMEALNALISKKQEDNSKLEQEQQFESFRNLLMDVSFYVQMHDNNKTLLQEIFEDGNKKTRTPNDIKKIIAFAKQKDPNDPLGYFKNRVANNISEKELPPERPPTSDSVPGKPDKSHTSRDLFHQHDESNEQDDFVNECLLNQNNYTALRGSGLLRDILGKECPKAEFFQELSPEDNEITTSSTFKYAKEYMSKEELKSPIDALKVLIKNKQQLNHQQEQSEFDAFRKALTDELFLDQMRTSKMMGKILGDNNKNNKKTLSDEDTTKIINFARLLQPEDPLGYLRSRVNNAIANQKLPPKIPPTSESGPNEKKTSSPLLLLHENTLMNNLTDNTHEKKPHRHVFHHAFKEFKQRFKQDELVKNKHTILEKFEKLIKSCTNMDELNDFKRDITTNNDYKDDYKVLATGQGVATQMGLRQSGSLKKLDKMFDEKKKELESLVSEQSRNVPFRAK